MADCIVCILYVTWRGGKALADYERLHAKAHVKCTLYCRLRFWMGRVTFDLWNVGLKREIG